MSSNNSVVKYLECNKSGYHYGEALNVVCLETNCTDKALCCSACVEEDHKKHQTKPLKLVINEAKDHSSKLKPIVINTDSVLEIIKKGQMATLDNLQVARTKVNHYFMDVEKSINSYYSSLAQQIKLKTSKSQEDIQKLFEDIHHVETPENLLAIVQKIVTFIPKKDSVDEPVQESELLESLNTTNAEINDKVAKFCEDLTTKSEANLNALNKTIADKDIWSKDKFKFSPKFKHAEITYISPEIVKSGATSSYKFAIMEPDIEKFKGVKRMAFKIKETSKNWLAVGVCHKNIVVSKNYSFTFNVLGHGAYMVSSNGGSWSDTKSEANNVVKSFKFGKNDIILMTVNFDIKKLKFKKKATNQNFELDFQTNATDPLHPCVLFYYENDEVEFLPDYKDW